MKERTETSVGILYNEPVLSLGTHELFEELGRHAKGRVGHRSVLIMGLVRSQLNVFFVGAFLIKLNFV